MKKRIFILLTVATLAMTSCGANAPVADNGNAPVENTDATIKNETEENSQTKVEHFDTDVRGNSAGNLANGGLTCSVSENEFLFFTPYDNAAGNYDRNTTVSKLVFPSGISSMNVYDGFLYGIANDNNKAYTILVKQNLKNRNCEFLKTGSMVSLSVVNGVLYYTDINGNLYSRTIDTNEEKCLIESNVASACIYKDRIYYIDLIENFCLRVADIDGSNSTRLYDENIVNNFILYEDYIYFYTADGLKRMGLDEDKATSLDEVSVGCFNIANDILYYVDQEDSDYIKYIDLNGDLKPQKIDFKQGLISYYHSCEGDGEQSISVLGYTKMNISGDYMYLCANFDVDGKKSMAQFCYDLNSFSIPTRTSQPSERFDFENYNALIITWVLADNVDEFKTLTGTTVNINYTKEALEQMEKLAEGEYITVEKETKPEPGKANTASLDEQTVQAAIYALQGEYPEGMSWTMADYREFHGGQYCGGHGCAAFAFVVSDAVFGTLQARKIYDINEARVGDIINTHSPTAHSMVVLAVNEDSITVCEGNFNSSIHWGRTISKAELQAGLSEILTRYP